MLLQSDESSEDSDASDSDMESDPYRSHSNRRSGSNIQMFLLHFVGHCLKAES